VQQVRAHDRDCRHARRRHSVRCVIPPALYPSLPAALLPTHPVSIRLHGVLTVACCTRCCRLHSLLHGALAVARCTRCCTVHSLLHGALAVACCLDPGSLNAKQQRVAGMQRCMARTAHRTSARSRHLQPSLSHDGCHICTGTGLTPALTCIGTGLTLANARLGSLPSRRQSRDWAECCPTSSLGTAGSASGSAVVCSCAVEECNVSRVAAIPRAT
jgi:hypothetical protein